MTTRFTDIAETFASVDDEMRLELLLDYARKLPPIPDRLKAERDAGVNKVPECMTPVFLWMESDDGQVRMYIDVAEEAPTVKGLMGILVRSYDGATAAELEQVPTDLLNRLHLAEQIRMQRAVGISGIVGRIRRRAAELQNQPDASAVGTPTGTAHG